MLVCLLLAVGTSCSPRTTPAKRKTASINYPAIVAASQEMLPRIVSHVRALSDFGPRQTGQQGAAQAYAYIRGKLSEIAPDLPQKEFLDTVTVAMDRAGGDELLSADDSHSHLVAHLPGKTDKPLAAYSLTPNSAQSCLTHKAGTCVTGDCRACEKPRRVIDLGDGSFEAMDAALATDSGGLNGAIVLLDFNSGDAWLRSAALGAAGAVFVEPTDTTVYQADAKFLSTVPLSFPRLYLPRQAS
jgi:hypothetical protein